MTYRLQLAGSLILLILSSVAPAAQFEVEVAPRPDDKFKSAKWSMYLPDGLKMVRAIIVHQHGCGRNGIECPYDLQWQALARKHDAVLLGSHLVPNGPCTDWHEPTNGSNDAFLLALKKFGEQSKHPEIADAPWALWGHSGGAYWAVSMAQLHPDRTIAVFARSGGRVPADKAYGVPILFQFGLKEETDRFKKIADESKALVADGRAKGAVWSLAIDPQSSHDTRNSRLLAIPWFDAVLSQRLSASGGKLNAVDGDKGWLGDSATKEIAAAGTINGDKTKLGWLPDEATAQRWKQFVSTGTVIDETPPPAPTQLKLTTADGKSTLGWAAEPDLESGIKAFNIYRNGEKVGTVAGNGEPKMPPVFQYGNYGDEPAPKEPKMSWTDKDEVPAGKPALYEVSAVNHSDKESPRTAVK